MLKTVIKICETTCWAILLMALLLALTLKLAKAQEPLAFENEYVVRTKLTTMGSLLPAVTVLMHSNVIAEESPRTRKLVKAKIMGDYCPWSVGVTSCSINYFYKAEAQTIPWGMKEFPGVNAINVWPEATGKGNIVVVMDTGIDLTHPDLVNNLWINDKETKDGIDNDNNGCVDDINGCNFADANAPQDRNGHGTHCAGIIGATANAFGVKGVAPNVRVVAVKVLGDSGGGSVYSIVKGIDYVTALKRSGVNIVAINASFGSTGYSQPMRDAIEDAGRAGILFVAAAGNNGTNNDDIQHYPSGYKLKNIISVGAIDSQGQLAYFTNFGAGSVHLFGPGVSIFSTYKQGLYEYLSGTSMATPYIAGISALLPGTAQEKREKILKGVVKRNAYTQKSITGGAGNARNALDAGDEPTCQKIRCRRCNADCKKNFKKQRQRRACRETCRIKFNCDKGECKKV